MGRETIGICSARPPWRSLLFFCPRGTSRVDYLSTTSTTLLLFLSFFFFFILYLLHTYFFLTSHRYNVRATSRIMHNGEESPVFPSNLSLSFNSSLFIFLDIALCVTYRNVTKNKNIPFIKTRSNSLIFPSNLGFHPERWNTRDRHVYLNATRRVARIPF